MDSSGAVIMLPIIGAAIRCNTSASVPSDHMIGAPGRTPSGYRSYRAADLERLVFIRRCRSLGMPLAGVRRLIELSRDKSV